MTSNNCGIYKITSTVTGKFYIGSAVNIKKRWAYHRSQLGANKHHNRHLQNSWNKHGEDSFTFEVLECCEKERLIEREQFYIDNEKPAYNISPTAGNRLGVKLTGESKRKMSEAHKSLWTEEYKLKHRPTEEHLHKMHEANKGRKLSEEQILQIIACNTGRKHTEETRRKMSEARKGKPLSEEHKRKISEALKGRKLSEEQILQIIACNTGRKHTEEARKHMSEAHIGKPSNWRGKHHTEETKRKLSEAQHKRHKEHPATEETRRKLSEAQKGHPNYNLKPPSEETKRKTSESLKRYWAERKANV